MMRCNISGGSIRASGVFTNAQQAIVCCWRYAERAELGQLAPGVITRPKARIGTAAQRRELVRWLQLAFLAMALVGCTALVSGLLARLYFGV